ncbi:hypothetical protein AVEN_265254-1 [Araneus ventricosus]|uniref:Uncharacterized protein n=1 Tax=Araneus ventricosus TaxID=182803 RepID=A0A4Y2U9J4_ARAVE|nr:hypothetical protein AVEN_265254-1 [Araneus ventricosus]
MQSFQIKLRPLTPQPQCHRYKTARKTLSSQDLGTQFTFTVYPRYPTFDYGKTFSLSCDSLPENRTVTSRKGYCPKKRRVSSTSLGQKINNHVNMVVDSVEICARHWKLINDR